MVTAERADGRGERGERGDARRHFAAAPRWKLELLLLAASKMMQRVLVGLLALLSCALAAPVAPATAAAPLKPVAKAKGGGRSDMMKGLAATLSPDNKKAFKALVAEKKLAKGEAAIPRPQRTQHAPLATRHASALDHLAATLPSFRH
jgi:hypothetical protein